MRWPQQLTHLPERPPHRRAGAGQRLADDPRSILATGALARCALRQALHDGQAATPAGGTARGVRRVEAAPVSRRAREPAGPRRASAQGCERPVPHRPRCSPRAPALRPARPRRSSLHLAKAPKFHVCNSPTLNAAATQNPLFFTGLPPARCSTGGG